MIVKDICGSASLIPCCCMNLTRSILSLFFYLAPQLFLMGYWSRTSHRWWDIIVFLISRLNIFIAGQCSSLSQRVYINDWLIVNSLFVIILNYKLHFLLFFAYLDCYLCIFTSQALLVSCDWSAKSYGVVSYSWLNKQTHICVKMEHSASFNICIYVLEIHCYTTQVFECS